MLHLGLVGTFILDRIVPLRGPEIESLGGLYHSLAYAALLGENAFRLTPVSRVGENARTLVESRIKALPGVNTNALLATPLRQTSVMLIYRTANERDEITTAPMAPVLPGEVGALRNADAVLFNLITGEDTVLDTLAAFEPAPGRLVYLDFHSRALGIDSSGKRYYRQPTDWRSWARRVDVLQMNELEAACLAGLRHPVSEADLRSFVRDLFSAGRLLGVHVTLGEKGVLSAVRQTGGVQFERLQPAISQEDVVDIIGCGDAFGAAFLVHYLQKADFFAAAAFANRIAALSTMIMGSVTPATFEKKIGHHAIIED